MIITFYVFFRTINIKPYTVTVKVKLQSLQAIIIHHKIFPPKDITDKSNKASKKVSKAFGGMENWQFNKNVSCKFKM